MAGEPNTEDKVIGNAVQTENGMVLNITLNDASPEVIAACSAIFEKFIDTARAMENTLDFLRSGAGISSVTEVSSPAAGIGENTKSPSTKTV